MCSQMVTELYTRHLCNCQSHQKLNTSPRTWSESIRSLGQQRDTQSDNGQLNPSWHSGGYKWQRRIEAEYHANIDSTSTQCRNNLLSSVYQDFLSLQSCITRHPLLSYKRSPVPFTEKKQNFGHLRWQTTSATNKIQSNWMVTNFWSLPPTVFHRERKGERERERKKKSWHKTDLNKLICIYV